MDMNNESENELPSIQLKIERRSSHPWIFQKMVEKPRGNTGRVANGCIVNVVERDGKWVGRGLYNAHSRIALRILTAKQDEAIDRQFFSRKIQQAYQLRQEILQLNRVTDAYRLIHSEADGLSGLVVDRFADCWVLEFFASGMYYLRETIQSVLLDLAPQSNFYWFAEDHVCKQESFDCRSPAPPEPFLIQENGLKFRVAPGSKHKTGFFLDQRDNRRRLSQFCSGKTVLDLCCNSGGFGIYAKTLGKAQEVTGIDLDEQVLTLAKQNAQLNQATIRYIQADLFTWLRDIAPSGRTFDVVILDPAKLTRDRESVDQALRKYRDMNRLAMQAVAPGGILLTCSCTGLVSEADFLDMVRQAAWQAGREALVFQICGAASDHPFMLHASEGRYLKAVFCRIL